MPQPLIVEQQVAAPPPAVFRAWSSPQILARWWWPHIPDTRYEIDLREGGRYRIVSQSAGIGVGGEFTKVIAPNQFAMTWNWENEGVTEAEETVTVSLSGNEYGTLVSVLHEVADIAGDVESQRQGWESVLERLGGLFVA